MPSAYKIINSIQYINFSKKQAVLNLHNEFKDYKKNNIKNINNFIFNKEISVKNLSYKNPESDLLVLKKYKFNNKKK